MAVNREYRCTFHDHEFESIEERPACPFGCSADFVVMEFRTPFGTRSAETKFRDWSSKDLASAYNMSDVRSDKEGTSVMSNTPLQSGGARIIGNKPSAYWNADIFPVKPGWAGAGEAAPAFTPPKSYACAATPIEQIRAGASNHLKRATQYLRHGKH